MNTKTFTLIEVAISMAILVIAAAATLSVLYVGDMSWRTDMGLVDLQHQTRQAVYIMVREIREIDPTSQINIIGGSDIRFSIEDRITTGGPFTYTVRYYLNANNQIIRESPTGFGCGASWDVDHCQVLANDVNNLNFCCWDAGTDSCFLSCPTAPTAADQIRIVAGAQRTVKGGPRTINFDITEQARLRNNF